jgi:aldose 1-epimerase
LNRFTLTNRKGIRAVLTNYGAMLTELHVPDSEGQFGDVVLGFDNSESYLKGHPYFGATTGRVANRIAHSSFTLNGHSYSLAANNGPHHLHGGLQGLDKRVWQSQPVTGQESPALKFSYLSPDGEEGYPGNLNLIVTYTLTQDNALRIDYEATTDQDTPVNLTNHSYFNLATGGRDSILDHVMEIQADHYTPVDNLAIPTGAIEPVAGTAMDFRQAAPIGTRIDQEPLQGDPGGYDHNYVLQKTSPGHLDLAARVHDPVSGRVLEIHTTEPGIQFYTGNFLDGTLTGKNGAVYEKRHGFCLEAQHFPDALHHDNFPAIILRPGETYRQTTLHRFSTL